MTNPATPYLEAAFREYFRDAADVTIDFDADEKIHVHVLRPTSRPDNFRLVSWECVINSDDDRYIFVRNGDYGGDVYANCITVPLMPEEN